MRNKRWLRPKRNWIHVLLPAVIFCCLHPLLATGGNIFSPPWARTRCCNLPRQELATQLRLKSCQILFAKNAQCTSTATYIKTFCTYFCHQSAISALKAHKFIIVEYYYDFHCCVSQSLIIHGLMKGKRTSIPLNHHYCFHPQLKQINYWSLCVPTPLDCHKSFKSATNIFPPHFVSFPQFIHCLSSGLLNHLFKQENMLLVTLKCILKPQLLCKSSITIILFPKCFLQSFCSKRAEYLISRPFAGTNWNVSVGVGRGHPILLN